MKITLIVLLCFAVAFQNGDAKQPGGPPPTGPPPPRNLFVRLAERSQAIQRQDNGTMDDGSDPVSAQQSCNGRCDEGKKENNFECQCDKGCHDREDCCQDLRCECPQNALRMHRNEIDLKIAAFTCEKCPDSQDPEEGDDKLPEGCEFMKDLCDRFDNDIDTDGVPETLKDMKNTLKAIESDEIEDVIRDKLGVEPEVFKECMEDMEKKRRMFSKKLKEELLYYDLDLYGIDIIPLKPTKDGGFYVRLRFDSFDTEPVSLEHIKKSLRDLECKIGCIQFAQEYCEDRGEDIVGTAEGDLWTA